MVALVPCSLRNLHLCMGLASLPLRALRLPRFHKPSSAQVIKPSMPLRMLVNIVPQAFRFLRVWLKYPLLGGTLLGVLPVLLVLLVLLLVLLPHHSGRVRPCGKVPLWILGALRRHHQPVWRPRAPGDHQFVVPPLLVLTCPWGT